MKKLLLIGILGLVAVASQAQFSFLYEGPEFLYVNDDCLAELEWGHPNTPQAFPTQGGQQVVSFEIFSISGGYQIGSLIPPNTVVTVFYQATDNFGQTALFGFNLFSIDTIGPEFDPFSLPDDITLECGESLPTYFLEVDDNCASDESPIDVIYTEEGVVNGCDGGDLLRIWTATDESSNQTQFIQTVTFEGDDVPPVFTGMPVDGSAECGEAVDAYSAWIDQQRAAISVTDDGCGGVEWNDNAPPPSVLTMFCGVVTVTFFASDSCGNTTEVSVDFTVTNDVAPVIDVEASDIEIDCGVGNPQQTFQNWIDSHGGAEATDDCSFLSWYTVPEDPVLGDTCDISTTVIFVADDGCGNTDSTSASYIVIDTVAPTIITPAQNRVVNCSTVDPHEELNTWLGNHGQVTGEDLCADTSVLTNLFFVEGMQVDSIALHQMLDAQLDSGCVDNVNIGGLLWNNVLVLMEVDFGIMDGCGNVASSAGVFAVTDNLGPTMDSLPQDVTFTCDGTSIEESFTNWYQSAGQAVASDDCGGVVFTGSPGLDTALMSLQAALDTACAEGASVEVSFQVEDICGNPADGQFPATFTVADSEPPVFIELPQDVTFDCSVALQQGIEQWLDTLAGAEAVDDCGTPDYIFQWTASNGETLQGAPGTGPYPDAGELDCSTELMVTFIASDVCGNSVMAGASFLAIDTLPPTLELDTSVTELPCDSLVNLPPPTASDNCDPSPRITFIDSFSGNGCELELVRTWIATDICGNTASIDQNYSITDSSAPILIEAPDDLVIECSEGDVDSLFNAWVSTNAGAIAEDPCSEANVFMAIPGSYNPDDPGTFPGTPPELPTVDTCSSDGVVLEVTADVVFYDECFNLDSRQVQFMVLDTSPPVISGCVDTISEFVDTMGCQATFSVEVPDFMDNCTFFDVEASYRLVGMNTVILGGETTLPFTLDEGSHRLVFYAEDCTGRIDSCITILQAVDTLVPGIQCPADRLLFAGDFPCVISVGLPAPLMSSDICTPPDSGGLQVFYAVEGSTEIEETLFPEGVDSAFIDFSVGVSLVYYIAEDISGNRDSCTFEIEVRDTVAPMAICQDITVEVNPSGELPAIVDPELIDDGSMDNCGIASMTVQPQEFPCDSAGTAQIVELTITDFSGNSAMCTSNITIGMALPQPGYSIGLCNTDTLQLLANPPGGDGGAFHI